MRCCTPRHGRTATGDTRLVAEYLGHADLSTVARYAHALRRSGTQPRASSPRTMPRRRHPAPRAGDPGEAGACIPAARGLGLTNAAIRRAC